MQNGPIGNNGGSLNWYLYVRNNPVNWTDPTGLKTCINWGHTPWVIKNKIYGSWEFYTIFPPDNGILPGKALCTWKRTYSYVKSAIKIKKCWEDCSDQFSWFEMDGETAVDVPTFNYKRTEGRNIPGVGSQCRHPNNSAWITVGPGNEH